MKMKYVKFLFLLFVSAFVLISCDDTPDTVTAQPTAIPQTTPAITPTTEPTLTGGTPTPTPMITHDPRFDSPDAHGPFTFGERVYKVYISDTVVFFDSITKEAVFELSGLKITDKERFFISASFMDLNFDMVGDFSYVDAEGKRQCYLAAEDASGNISYHYNESISSLYSLTRCYETGELFARESAESDEFYSYKFSEDGVLEKDHLVADVFKWDVKSISEALAGPGVEVYNGEDTLIRTVKCKTYSIGGYITLAEDAYGNYYIKDMPFQGFCRLALNPSGNWSKSEKVEPDNLIVA